ncbi:MAG: DNA-protecting protein DprA [Oscillospiraceae bacterium]|nr:DNA-protecting protein DprA [Oscillospiraceae bacterium]
MASLEYWLWLSAAGVSPKARTALVTRYGDAQRAFFAPGGAFAAIPELSAKEAAILEKRDMSRVDEILAACRMQGLEIVSLQDAAYPNRLRNVYTPPVALYVKGRLPLVDENALIAVIGTRKASPYGIRMGREMAGQISRCGGIVVSGLTNGVDAAAARGALEADGICVGVLGTPHECEHGSLAAEVAAHGALVSEYPPGTQPLRSFFRERNRVASGLSVGVVVVEAPARSGTQLFIEEAAEQGKEIFAVPGNADAANSAGTLAMLKDGAKLVTSGWDVLSEFEALYPDKLKECAYARPAVEEPAEAPPAPEEAEKKAIDKPEGKVYIDLAEQLAGLTEDQLKIVTAIDRDASHIDDIIEATGLPTHTVLAQLTILEIKGYVRRAAGRRVVLNTAKK